MTRVHIERNGTGKFLLVSLAVLLLSSAYFHRLGYQVLPQEAPPARNAEVARSIWRTHSLEAPEFHVFEQELRRLALIGFSMGGNQVLKLAGEWGTDGPGELCAVVAVSPAIDLGPSADALHLPRVMRVDGAVAMAEAVYATLDLRDETQRSPGDALVGMQP